MLKLSFLIGLLMAYCYVAQAQDAPKSYVSAIGFYNLENLFDTIDTENVSDTDFTPNGEMRYNSKVYADKMNNLSHVISLMGKDAPDGIAVLGVAEIENRSVLEDLVKQPKIADKNYQILWFDSPDKRGIDCAFLYNPKYFKLKSAKPLRVGGLNAEGDTLFTRDITLMSGLFDGEEMHFMVGHWPSRRGGEAATAPLRQRAAKVCRQAADSLLAKNPNAKIMIMGDLNDNPDDISVKDIIGAEGKLKKVKPQGFYNPFFDPYKKGLGTLAHNDAWGLFDQIIISEAYVPIKPNSWYYKGAVVFNEKFLTQKSGRYEGYPFRTYSGAEYIGGYSDHFPTFIYLWKNKK